MERDGPRMKNVLLLKCIENIKVYIKHYKVIAHTIVILYIYRNLHALKKNLKT